MPIIHRANMKARPQCGAEGVISTSGVGVTCPDCTEPPLTRLKLAWLRDASVPQGQPALGRFDCPCGNQIVNVAYAGDETYRCANCGLHVDSRGWIIGTGIRVPGVP